MFSFASPTAVAAYRFLSRTGSTWCIPDSPHEWTLEGSHDGVSWSLLHWVNETAHVWGEAETRYYDRLDNISAYTHYRWRFDGDSIGGYGAEWTGRRRHVVIAEVQLFTFFSPPPTSSPPVPPSAPPGHGAPESLPPSPPSPYRPVDLRPTAAIPNAFGTASASSGSGGYAPAHAFDGVHGPDNNYWHSSVGWPDGGQWLKFSFDSPTAVAAYSFLSRTASCCHAADSPHEWKLEGSHDGVSWSLLHSVDETAHVWGSAEARYYDRLDNFDAYAHYRWTFDGDSIGSGENRVVVIAEVQLFAFFSPPPTSPPLPPLSPPPPSLPPPPPPPITDANAAAVVALWFSDEAAATSIYGHISEWTMSQLTNMMDLFSSLVNADATFFNADLSAWDCSSVTTMRGMFQGASGYNHPLSLDTGKVTDMRQTFKNTKVHFPLAFDTGRVTDLFETFRNCYLESVAEIRYGQRDNVGQLFARLT